MSGGAAHRHSYLGFYVLSKPYVAIYVAINVKIGSLKRRRSLLARFRNAIARNYQQETVTYALCARENHPFLNH